MSLRFRAGGTPRRLWRSTMRRAYRFPWIVRPPGDPRPAATWLRLGWVAQMLREERQWQEQASYQSRRFPKVPGEAAVKGMAALPSVDLAVLVFLATVRVSLVRLPSTFMRRSRSVMRTCPSRVVMRRFRVMCLIAGRSSVGVVGVIVCRTVRVVVIGRTAVVVVS